ncbi:MAG TPA: penicillin-binding transpeptidase domain-containing protein, partial [Tepidisphaeraceae bacterium]|nr:penicillin-binding transpeptidase domain-containing protein [Tepidisphaeraceae bacterium]
MFERRLRPFLLIVVLVGALLIGRAMQVQIVEGAHWRNLAAESLKRSELIDTTRGRILDIKGRVIAQDAPCIDVCVDYRALTDPPDRAWLRETAIRRLRANHESYRTTDAAGRRRLIEAEIEQVKADLENMWNRLAELGRRPRSEIDEIRRQTVERVEFRRKFIVARRYERALEQHDQKDPDPWYRKWLDDRSGQAPQLEEFEITLSEQTTPHVILHNVDNHVNIELARDLSKYPGLSLRPGIKRFYPYGEVASHALGRLSKVMREDLLADANFADELRQYLPNDLVGRTGLEAMNEQRLRGTRGRTERDVVTGNILSQSIAVPGSDVRTTIDIELQATIEQAFKNVKLAYGDRQHTFLPMPGAAVVIDIPTGEVRALVSYPNYDINDFDRLYNRLVRDELNRPLMNRATQFALEPGSTVKPLVGLTAISLGEFGPHDTIECTGYLVLDGRRYSYGRCWTMNIFNQTHQFGAAPHPNGFLSYTDAIERSCNVFFETLADRMGLEALVEGYRQFGLGQRTGIGIPEVPGLLPDASAGP